VSAPPTAPIRADFSREALDRMLKDCAWIGKITSEDPSAGHFPGSFPARLLEADSRSLLDRRLLSSGEERIKLKPAAPRTPRSTRFPVCKNSEGGSFEPTPATKSWRTRMASAESYRPIAIVGGCGSYRAGGAWGHAAIDLLRTPVARSLSSLDSPEDCGNKLHAQEPCAVGRTQASRQRESQSF